MPESIQFPTDTEAIEYATENNLAASSLRFEDDTWLINNDSSSTQSEHPSKLSKESRKSSIALRLGNYTGVGFVIRTCWKYPKYITGLKSYPKSYFLSNAMVYFDKRSAISSARYGSARREVLEVQIQNGKIIRIISRVREQ